MKDEDAGRRIMVSYALICGGPGAIGSFSALWLHSQGCTPAQTSHIIGSVLCITVLFNLAVSLLAHRVRRLSLILCGLCLICATGGSCMALNCSDVWHIGGWIAASLAITACVPIMDAANLANTSSRTGRFYKGRAAASLAYLCGSLVLGLVAARCGIGDTMGHWLVGVALLATLGLRRFPLPPDALPDRARLTAPPASGLRARTVPYGAIALIVVAATLIEASHGANVLVMLRWNGRGYDPALCAILWQIGECSDIALMWWLSRKPLDPSRLLVLGGVAATVRWAGFALEPSIGVISVLQMLHALSFTGTYIATIQLLDRMVSRQWRAPCQLMAWAVLLYLSKAAIMLTNSEADAGMPSFWLMSLLGLSGTACAVVAMFRTKANTPFKFHST